MPSRAETAVDLHSEGFNCAQAVLAAFAPALGMDRETALRISTGFGGGIGQLGWTCGTVTGAAMVISLLHGRTRADDRQTYETAKARVRQFVDQFVDRFGNAACSELIGVDISDPQAKARASREGVFRRLCPGFVRGAGEILEQMYPDLAG